jgi:O-Antigen ligase
MTSDLRRAFAIFLACLLAGYALMDKSFAYVGVGFLYVSEIGLLLGLLACCLAWYQGHLDFSLLKRPSIALLGAFLIWSLLCTVPYIHEYKLSALRDALLWGYAAFTFLILLLIRREWIERFFRWYGYAIPFVLLWWVLAFFLHWFAGIKHNPFNPAWPLLQLKSGDVAVHLAGIAAFTLLNLNAGEQSKRAVWLTSLIWLMWWANWFLYGIISRAAMLIPLLMLGMLLLVSCRPIKKWAAPVLSGVAMVVMLVVTNVHLQIPDPSRRVEISADQIAINIASLMGNVGKKTLKYLDIAITRPDVVKKPAPRVRRAERAEHQGPSVLRTETISWRVDWWKAIIAYTIEGPYFWHGKGYGVNLAAAAGITTDETVRSPHNVFMTILGRSGVPGLVLWCAFLLSVTCLLVKNAWAGNQSRDRAYAVWFLIYILASVLNGGIDVYLEGPMGGIWFWSLVAVTYVYFLRKQRPAAALRAG